MNGGKQPAPAVRFRAVAGIVAPGTGAVAKSAAATICARLVTQMRGSAHTVLQNSGSPGGCLRPWRVSSQSSHAPDTDLDCRIACLRQAHMGLCLLFQAPRAAGAPGAQIVGQCWPPGGPISDNAASPILGSMRRTR